MDQLKKNRKIFDLLSQAISEGVVIVDEKQHIVSTNKSADEIFGYEPGELNGKHLNVLIPKSYHDRHEHYVSEFVSHGDKRQMGHGRDLYGAHKDGHPIPVEAGLNPFEVDGKTFVMALVSDITQRKEQERKILELNADLEKKIRQRTKKLEETVKEVQSVNENLEDEIRKRLAAEKRIKDALKKERELNELKTKFLSMVSHEFKTPLSGILTSTILLGKYKLAEQQEKREKHLRTITDKVHYLNNILNDFLSVERLESGKVNYRFTTFRLSKVINEVVYNANMLLKSGQKIVFPPEVDEYLIRQDEKILELCLSNLVHNAIKYSPEDTLIEIGVKKKGDFLVLEVRDQGIGIPEASRKNIFSRYYRAENALNDQGTGIGLNIVQGHLKNLGGNITFTSDEGKGSTFIMTVPIVQE